MFGVENLVGNKVGVVVDAATGVASFAVVAAVEGFVDINVNAGGVDCIGDGVVITTVTVVVAAV